MVIWKYPLELVSDQTLSMPRGAQILTVQVQGDVPTLWALVDPGMELESRSIWTVGTGHPLSGDSGAYIGTYMTAGGLFVWHVFERRS